MANEVCSDTGPILHLYEIKREDLFLIFDKIYVSNEVLEELKKYSIIKFPNNIKIEKVNVEQVALLVNKYLLGLGESSALWLCLSLKIPTLLTDDLEVRDTAIILGLKPVGTLGIILRAMREKIINKQEARNIIFNLPSHSSLFITKDLIDYALSEIEKFEMN